MLDKHHRLAAVHREYPRLSDHDFSDIPFRFGDFYVLARRRGRDAVRSGKSGSDVERPYAVLTAAGFQTPSTNMTYSRPGLRTSSQ